MIRKFYDVAATDTAALPQQIGLAEAMAKSGIKTSGDFPVIDIPDEIKDEKPASGPAPAEPAKEALQADTTKETPPPAAEQKREEPQKAADPAKVPTWQEVLRQQQPDTVLKELLGGNDSLVGFVKSLKEVDPKMVAFLNHWQSGGDMNEYLQVLTTDYSKMSAEDVMRHQLRSEYPKASREALEALYQEDVVEKYKLDPEKYSEDEVRRGRLLIEAKADNFRDKLLETQQSKLFPKPPDPKAEEPDKPDRRSVEQMSLWKQKVNENPFTKNILSSKEFSFGEGDNKFSYKVDTNKLMDVIFDSEKFAATQFDIEMDSNGEVKSISPKTEHQLLTHLVAIYGMDFMNAYAEHFKSQGHESAIAPIDNASNRNSESPAQPATKFNSLAEGMAKSGMYHSGGR